MTLSVFGRHKIIIFLFFFVFTMLTAPSLKAESSLVDRGNRMLAKAEYEKAMTFFKAAIKEDGSNQAAWDGYQKATLAKENADKNKLDFNNIPENPSEMTEKTLAALQTVAKPSVSIEDLSAQQKAVTEAQPSRNANSIASFSSEMTNPWKGLSVFKVVDPTLLHSPTLAKNRFEEEKKPYRVWNKDKFGTGVEANVTYVPLDLYKYHAVALGAELGWTYKETEMRYVLISKNAKKYHEFAIDIREIVSPRKYPFIADIAKRTTLEDDNGHVYQPVTSAGPSQEQLKRADTYSVAFPQLAEDGVPIQDKAKDYLYIVIKGLGDARDIKKLRFDKELFLANVKKTLKPLNEAEIEKIKNSL
jgi:hypothetical protein